MYNVIKIIDNSELTLAKFLYHADAKKYHHQLGINYGESYQDTCRIEFID